MGTVFNIQHFSVHDGPGIRTVVFLKGCPLRCRWCANPESQRHIPEIAWSGDKCVGCGGCTEHLTELSCRFEEDGLYWDADGNFSPQEVERVCPSKALHVIGHEMTADEVLDEVKKDERFFETSGGGITLSGGEPLMQPEFAREILIKVGEAGIHRTIETCGYADWRSYESVVVETDFLLTDIKMIDPDEHKKWTGIDNTLILENLKKAATRFPNLHIQVRTPVIPRVNDTKEAIAKIVDFVNEIGADYELLKYHRYGEPKYKSLNRSYPMGDADLSEEDFLELQSFAIQHLLPGRHYGKAKSGMSQSYYYSDGAGI